MYIHWSDDLALGNKLIDTQHRMLLMLCRKLDIAIKSQQSEQTVQRTILEVKKFIEFHFVSEENLMHEIHYPDVERHAKIHNALLIDLQIRLSKMQHKADFPDDVLYELYKWLLDHVVHEDLKIAHYVQNSPHRPLGEDLYNQLFSGA